MGRPARLVPCVAVALGTTLVGPLLLGAVPFGSAASLPAGDPSPAPRDVGSIVFLQGGRMRTVDASSASDAALVTPSTGVDPQWSPNGTEIAFRAADRAIHTTYGVGLGERTVTSGASDSQPSWSPDGAAIVFTRAVSTGTDLFRVDVDGSDLRRLTTSGHASGPAWSPTGRIAYSDDSSSSDALYSMASDGSGVTRLASGATAYDALDWSPDGARLAYAGGDGIHTVAADGAGDARVTQEAGDSSPSWSPSGENLVFAGHDERAGTGLVVIDDDGGDPRVITTATDGPTAPDWGPVVPTSLAVFRAADYGRYYVRGESPRSTPGYGADARRGDAPVPDQPGLGDRDTTVYRPSTSTFYRYSEPLGDFVAQRYGRPGDVPVDASPLRLFRPSDGTWYGKYAEAVHYGRRGDVPAPADYDGEGPDGSVVDDDAVGNDVAVFRPSEGTWYVRGAAPVAFGRAGDVPVPADYRGTGRADIAVFRPSDGTWYVRGAAPVAFGRAGDVPLPGDYVGDGTTQMALYRPSNHTFYVRGLGSAAYGRDGDVPAPGRY